MADIQSTSDSKPLGQSPTSPPTHGGGSPAADLIGDSMPLGQNEVWPPTHQAGMGEVQQVGESMSLGRNVVQAAHQGLPMTNIGGPKK